MTEPQAEAGKHPTRAQPARPRAWMWFSWAAWLAVLLAPFGKAIPYAPGAAFSDIAVAHLPQILYLRRALALWHTVPLWAPTYYSGYPFYADPLSGLWYLPGWLAVALPLPWGLTLTVGLHWLLSAWGMDAFLRQRGRGEAAAWLGAFAWLGFSKVWAHWGAGHLTLLYAVAWTPWLLWAAEGRRRWWRPAGVLALIFLADPRWAAYAGGLWALWELYLAREARPDRKAAAAALLRRVALEGSLAAALAAPLALPLLHYTALSTRSALTPRDVLAFSLPWARLAGVLAPVGGMYEWVAYPGAVALLLAVLAWLRGQARFWGGVAALALLWALGQHIPLLLWLGRVPGINLLRVPPRGLFLLGFAVAVAAAEGLEARPAGRGLHRGERLTLFALVVAGVVLSAALGIATGRMSAAGWGVTMWLLAAAGLWGLQRSPRWRYALGALLALDLLFVAHRLSVPHPWKTEMRAPAVLTAAPVPAAPVPAGASFRFYTPSYSLPQQVAAARGWELANGVDPLVLASYADFLSRAGGVPLEGYTVVLPPLKDGDLRANCNAALSPALLGLLNVRFLVAVCPLGHPALQEVAHRGGLWLYRNTQARPRAWVETVTGWQPAAAVRWTPNAVTVWASGPGKLVLSEMAYPGWRVSVDGRPVESGTAHEVLRAVPLPAGEHVVVWRFRPRDLYLGLVLALLGLVGVWRFPARLWEGKTTDDADFTG